MKYMKAFCGDKEISRVALGCMRIGGMTEAQADAHILGAVENGINFFDHADIYGGGMCETVFGGVLKRHPGLRDSILIQTKCGIRPGMYDFSKEHILEAVDGSLRRLGVDHVDVLLLHRPDLLMEPETVAAAFDELASSGKVGAFGVSNFNALQIELLKTCVTRPLLVNQMQLSIPHATMISSGANVNMTNADGTQHDGYLRDYCRLHGITIQPWSPLQHGFISGAFLNDDRYAKLTDTLRTIGEKYGLDETGMSIAWLLRLPDKMQPVVGTTNPDRVRQAARAADVGISAADWYAVYRAAGYVLP